MNDQSLLKDPTEHSTINLMIKFLNKKKQNGLKSYQKYSQKKMNKSILWEEWHQLKLE